MDRRSFLKSLIATAIATQIPALPAAEAAAVRDHAYHSLIHVTINGKEPYAVSIEPAANGWYRCAAWFKAPGGLSDIDFTSINNGKGVYVDSDHPMWLGQLEAETGKDDYQFSCYIKPEGGPDGRSGSA